MLGKLFVTMMVFAVVMMVPAPVIMVMGAALGFIHQPAVEIRGNKRLHRGVRFTRPDLDAFLGEDGQRAPANTPTMMTFAPCSRSQRGKSPGACGGGVTGRMLIIFRCPGSACTSVISRHPPKCP